METAIVNFKNIPEDGQPFRDMINLSRFRDLQPTLRGIILNKREQNMSLYGRPDPFYVWEDVNTPNQLDLLFDHFDFEYVCTHNLPFWIVRMSFESEDDAKIFIDGRQLDQPNLSIYQKGVVALRYKDTHIRMGKINMSFGGKGVEIENKQNTMLALADVVDCSIATLYKIEYINFFLQREEMLQMMNLDREEILKKLDNGDVSLEKVYKLVKEGTKCKVDEDTHDNCSTEEVLSELRDEVQVIELKKEPYTLPASDEYSVAYVNAHFDFTKKGRSSEMYIDNLKKMNLAEIMHAKSSTIIFRTSIMFLPEAQGIVNSWDFSHVDSLVVKCDKARYKSKYAEQYHDLLLICERNNVGVPLKRINTRTDDKTILDTEVFDVIDSMFNPDLEKVGIFTESRKGWDTYNYDPESKEMIKFFTKAS